MNIGRPRILTVDDNDQNRYAVRRVLQVAGFEVGEATTGAEGLRKAREEQFDLVLLDINLPDIDGFDVCRRLKATPETSAIPVLHMTASYGKPSDQAQGLDAGAEAYLIEPVEPEVLLATIRAVLRARHAEDVARNLAREWETSFDAIRDGVALIDIEGRIQRVNESMVRLLGRGKAELTGQSCTELWGSLPMERQPFKRALLHLRRENLELEYDGRLLSITVDPVFDGSGDPRGAVQIVSDITETRRLQEQFREAQKFETVGTLAAGVAHDFNNLLTTIMGNASLAMGEVEEGGSVQERLTDIVRASQRAADLTRQLLAYSGKGRHFLQRTELSAVLRGMAGLVDASVPKKVRVEWHLGSGLPQIEADANQLQQLVMNLVSNAAEAIGDTPGVIRISTGTENGAPYLEVADNGCGMDGDTKGRIFDPFFTTKFTGRGLGLAAVAGIARGHKASIEVTSAPGNGSTFRVIFASEAPAPAAPTEALKAPAGQRTILVVDDEDMIRRIAKASLEIRGYRVLLAANGLEAIEMVEKHGDIELVLLDLTMPIMNGEEAIDRIQQTRPRARVVVSTGYSHREAAARFNRKSVNGFLHKPYTAKQLTDTVDAVLNSR